jgi:hypothetical protein
MFTPGPSYEELEREIERMRALLDGDFQVTRLHYEVGKPVEIQARAAVLGELAAVCRDLLGDAPNFVELKFQDDLGKLAVVVQRLEGETPADKAARLTKALDRANAIIGDAADEAKRLQDRIDELEAQLRSAVC